MSSILRALKKLENEPRHQEAPPSLDSTFIPLADTGIKRSASRIFMLGIAGGIACGLVILAGWWLFSEKSQPTPDVNQKISQQKSKPDRVSSAPSQGLNTQEVPAPSKITEESSMESLVAQEATEPVINKEPVNTEKPVFRPTEPGTTSPVEKTLLAETDQSQTRETPDLAPKDQAATPYVKPATASVSRPAPPANKTIAVQIPKLKDKNMKLQAITWSKKPAKRIAVINNRILREGETVSGYHINIINQDDIILTKNEEKWKLMFH